MKAIIPKDFDPSIMAPAYLVRKRLLDSINIYSKKLDGDLLDFGCGSKPYKPLFSNVKSYTGVDIENPGHSHENEEIDYYYDGKTLPFENERFDAVFTTEVFEHVFNLDEIIPEIKRVMKNDGLILMTCPFAICEHEIPTDFARYTSFALKHIFTKHGFEIIAQEKLGNSIEVVTQLWIIYLEIHIIPHLKKIPLLGSLIRFLTHSCLNLTAILLGKILPQGKELYLNNLILCRKKAADL